VRDIERVLGEKVERRRLKDFDYARQAPARDTEFARQPRQPQQRREKGAAAQPAGRTGQQRFRKPEARKTSQRGSSNHPPGSSALRVQGRTTAGRI
nr:hypothetical protein [Nitrospiraceae bacterium]